MDRQLVTQSRLVDELRDLGVQPGTTLLAHTSLSSLGWVCGGAQTVVHALESAVGPQGTLVVPTHSWQLTDPSVWSNPSVPEEWWPTIREELPAFDADLTPTSGSGAIPETFRKADGVRRSRHPNVSFAARGPKADDILGDHTYGYSLGEDSPIGRLYELGGSVLLLGVDHSVNTSLHLAEYRWSGSEERRLIQAAPVAVDGERRWIEYDDIRFDVRDFSEIGRAYEEEADPSIGTVGEADARLMDQPSLVDFATDWMERNR